MNKKTKICLNAMVGNESNTITRMLESVIPYIDYYVIQCNGQDNTKKLLMTFLQKKEYLVLRTNLNGTILVLIGTIHFRPVLNPTTDVIGF